MLHIAQQGLNIFLAHRTEHAVSVGLIMAKPTRPIRPLPPLLLPAGMTVQEATWLLVRHALEHAEGNVSEASRAVGLGRKTIHKMLRERGATVQTRVVFENAS